MTAPRSTTLTRPADTREGMGRDGWREDALCRQVDPEAFYPVSTTDPHAYDDARAICALCPVRDACLAAAMTAEGGAGAAARFGMWGGMTPSERAALYSRTMRRKREGA